MNIVFPEIILLETLQSALAFVRKDYADQTDKGTTYLFKLLNGNVVGNYKMYDNAVQLICGAEDDPRRFEIDLMFNMDRSGPPTAHITLPAEMSDDRGNGMGMDEGYQDHIYETETNEELSEQDSETTAAHHTRAIFARRQQAVYNIVVTSDNSNEVVLLYHFLKALLIAVVPHLHLKGLQNVKFGGRDLEPYTEAQAQLYQRAVQLSLQYDSFVPSIHVSEMLIGAEIGDATKPVDQ